jgi:murein L,D-transpeptidase YafK
MRILFGLLIAALIIIGFADQNRPVMRLVDGAWRFLERADHLNRYRMGKPLRGTPDLARLDERLSAKDLALGAPIFMRIFKKESELELWMKKGPRYVLFATYPICRWSGDLGPKLAQGDRQSPEGFYTVARRQLNPNSRWHLSFNLGYPNAFDRSQKRTGDYLMVHGGCGSIGCYAVTNPVIDEIWQIITKAFASGQPRFHVHVMPFRWSDWNTRLHEADRWRDFWSDLRRGHDLFETTGLPPSVSVCRGRYAVAPASSGAKEHAEVSENCAADGPLAGTQPKTATR